MKAPIYILLIVLVTSCNKTIDIKGKTLYTDLDHAPSIPTEKLFSKIEVIPLETQEESIIRSIDKIMEIPVLHLYFRSTTKSRFDI